MDRLQRAAVLLSLVEHLRMEQSWCGETHVQKATYFLQELAGVPLDLDFVLYKHGPFSFDLRDDLGAMLGDGQLALQPQKFPYGPKHVLGERSSLIMHLYARTIERYRGQTEFVAAKFGKMSVAELERIATALFVTQEEGAPSDVEPRAQRLHELKPHIQLEEARGAVRRIDEVISEFHAAA